MVLLFAVCTGLVFPAVVTGMAKVIFPHQAKGSLIEDGGKIIGSELIGQNFTAPGYFHPRPSAAGGGYDGSSSFGTNLGPTSDKLINGIHKKTADGKDDPGNFDGIKDLSAAYRKENNLPAETLLPSDAVTRSASGLDPEISPANAELQAERIATARGMDLASLKQIVAEHTKARQLGFFGEPRINVLLLNIALDKSAPLKK